MNIFTVDSVPAIVLCIFLLATRLPYLRLHSVLTHKRAHIHIHTMNLDRHQRKKDKRNEKGNLKVFVFA